MKVEIDNNYGADADGNRGQVERFYEIDDDDYDDIVAQIQEAFNIGAIDEGDSTLDVVLICPDTEDTITFTVKISDYAKFDWEEL